MTNSRLLKQIGIKIKYKNIFITLILCIFLINIKKGDFLNMFSTFENYIAKNVL